MTKKSVLIDQIQAAAFKANALTPQYQGTANALELNKKTINKLKGILSSLTRS
jgi:hypothetical protein